MENSPIPENTEGEMTASPQEGFMTEDDRPKARYFNDKSHLVWERERIQRKREDIYKRNDPITMHTYMKDQTPMFSTSTTRGKQMAYDFTKPSKRSEKLINHLKSTVPILSDHYKGSKTHASAAPQGMSQFEKVYFDYVSNQKKNTGLSNISNQSEYQQRLQSNHNVNSDKAPMSHGSLNKSHFEFNTARYNSMQSVTDGRQRMFHSSQVF